MPAPRAFGGPLLPGGRGRRAALGPYDGAHQSRGEAMDRLVKTFVALGFVVGLWGSALAAPIDDVTQPTDTIVLVHGQDDGTIPLR